jgi:hypothetical protein
MTCPHTKSCALFPLFSQESFLAIWKSAYCEADYQRCSRYAASTRGEVVPATLLPNGKHLTNRPKSR